MTAVSDSQFVDTDLRVEDVPPGEGRAVAVGAEQVAVFRGKDGQWHGLGAQCPHLGGPLADGLADARVVVCPLHGRTYDLVTGAEAGGGAPAVAWEVTAPDGWIRCRRSP